MALWNGTSLLSHGIGARPWNPDWLQYTRYCSNMWLSILWLQQSRCTLKQFNLSNQISLFFPLSWHSTPFVYFPVKTNVCSLLVVWLLRPVKMCLSEMGLSILSTIDFCTVLQCNDIPQCIVIHTELELIILIRCDSNRGTLVTCHFQYWIPINVL